MQKSVILKIVLFLTIIPLFASAINTDYFQDVEALKSKGNFVMKYGSDTAGIVCGDRLCSEIRNEPLEQSKEEQSNDSETLQVGIISVSDNISILTGVNGFTGGNIGVLAGNDGLLLIDDGLPTVLEAIKMKLEHLKTCDKCGDVKFLVNTHWHADHVGGNSHFGEHGAIIIAHENLRTLLSSPQQLEFYGAVYDAYPKEALPVITFEDSVFLYFNEEAIQVIHLPNGHTNNDSIVYFAESKVLHMGDHFFNGMFPFVDLDHGGSVQGLTKNIEEVLTKFPETVKVIPGHGNLGTMEDLREYHEMLVETRKIVEDQVNEGKNLKEIQAKGFPNKWKSWASGNIKTSIWIEFIYTDLTNKNIN